MSRIRVAIAGVGNCASSLVQGLHFYRAHNDAAPAGLMHPDIGGYRPGDIEVVAAFDVDRRKVGRPVEEAIFAAPNCADVFCKDLPTSEAIVQMGPVLDGVAPHMADYPDHRAFRVAGAPAVDVAAALREAGAELLVCYLPVGAERAVRAYAEACLKAGVALVNCVPVFVASDPVWAGRFSARGLPVVGDDVKSQVGATIVHRRLARLFADRGVALERTYQLNTGGNTDFLNMLARDRLASKKASKTEAVQSQLDVRLDADAIHIGPSDYVPWQRDNKVAFIRLEGRGFGGAPIELELRLSVRDSPNSAGVVIDAVRCAKLALERGVAGPLEGVSAYYMKTPPRQMRDSVARRCATPSSPAPGRTRRTVSPRTAKRHCRRWIGRGARSVDRAGPGALKPVSQVSGGGGQDAGAAADRFPQYGILGHDRAARARSRGPARKVHRQDHQLPHHYQSAA